MRTWASAERDTHEPWLTGAVDPWFADRAREVDGDVARALELATALGRALPALGGGDSGAQWRTLAAVAAEDLTAARVAEPHLDALAILDQARRSQGGIDLETVGADEGSTWGVFAAEGPQARLLAEQRSSGAWRVNGGKPWCSLAGRLSHALITAWVSDEQRGLFAVDLRASGVTVADTPWVGRGLADVRTGPVEFADVSVEPVGEPGWYLDRPGFAWGGISVAACWYGGAVGVGRALLPPGLSTQPSEVAGRRTPDQVASLHLGAVDAALFAAGCVLREAAAMVDSGAAVGAEGALLALRARQVVADAVDLVIRQVDHALGPGPLAFEAAHARRIDDLRLYVRQHHAERDTARLGARLASGHESLR